ncbi:MAG: serine hydrolase [Tissierella sp.]|nr:serine hydrolase [Tissierella sp.]
MTKRILSIVLVLTLILSMSFSVFAAPDSIDVNLNGENILLEDMVYIDDEGMIMVAIREVLEALDYEVGWNNEERSVTASKDSDVVEFKIGETSIISNGEELNTLKESVIQNGKTFVPLELLSNGLDFVIGWDNKYQSLNINEPVINSENFFKAANDEEIKGKLESYMDALEKNTGFYGSVLVAKDDNLLLSDGYGYADIGQLTTNKSQTKFAIGSVTKQFVAMSIMQLREQGLINVEDKVSKFFPEIKNGDLITIHNLLDHSSGLMNFTELPEFFMNFEGFETPTDVLELIKDKDLMYHPGEGFSYSNTNYLILGLIVEEISDMSYEEYINKNILEPLNMDDTGFSYSGENEIYDATAYSGHIEVAPVDDEILLANAYGAGSMYSTVEDLYRWSQALNTEKLVKKETLNEIFSDHIPIAEGYFYGYGWMLADLGFDKMIYHGGNTLGFTADITKLVDSNLTIVILSNKGYVDFTNIKNNLISIALGGEYEVPKIRETIEISDRSIYDKYVGEYYLLPEMDLEILKLEDKLYAQVAGQSAFELFPETETYFYAKLVDVQIEFIVDEEGNVNELIFTQNPLVLNSTRKGEAQ